MDGARAALESVLAADELEQWREVPSRVVALYKAAAPGACRLAAWASPVAEPEDQLWWHPATVTAWAELADLEKRAVWERLPDVPGIAGMALFVEPLPPPPVTGWVLAKAASFLAPVARPHLAVQRAIGGPNGLTQAIVNGLLGAGIGYGGGWLADRLAPDDRLEPGHMPLTGALVGAGLGAAPGLWQYSAELRSRHPGFRKLAADNATGVMFQPRIPVDAFNRAIWNDVGNPASAFGAKSPWGSDAQPLGTPPMAAAVTSGLLTGTAAASRSPVVSPWQVGIAAAVGAGKGWATGLTVGKILGALAGLSPTDQSALQRAGTWGGLISGVADALFH
jgi:hypothetical protein